MDYQEYQLGEVREAMENKQREDRYDEWITYDMDWLCDMSTSRHMDGGGVGASSRGADCSFECTLGRRS